jgi:hypothetical protein
MGYSLEDRNGFLGDFATNSGIIQLYKGAPRPLYEFLASGGTDNAELLSEVVASCRRIPRYTYIAELLRGANLPVIITDGVGYGKPEPIVRAISIRQPYAEMILRGIKRVEFRSRPTNLRERVHLYAALTPGALKDWKALRVSPGELRTGAIVGSVEIVDCKRSRIGGFEWLLAWPKRLRRPLKPRNQPQPGLWRPQF